MTEKSFNHIFSQRCLRQVAETIGFVQSTEPKLFPTIDYPPEEIEDTTSGPGAPDVEIFFTPTGYGSGLGEQR